MWDELRNDHLFTAANLRAAQYLIDLTTEYDMNMALPAAIPTLEALNSKNKTRVDNVFCSSLLSDRIINCYVNAELRPPQTDHYAIITEVDLTLDLALECPKRNWNGMS